MPPLLEIEPFRADDLERLCDLYNHQARDIGHIAPLSPDVFERLVVDKPAFDGQGLLVAREGGTAVGWVHAVVAAGSEVYQDANQKVARIRMLVFEPTRLDVGAALVTGAHAYLSGRGHTQIEAFHARAGYPFYRGLWMGGEPMAPVTLPHVHMALAVAGYRVSQQSVFMTSTFDTASAVHRRAAGLTLDDRPTTMAHEPMRESWIGFEPRSVEARLEGQTAGSVHWVMLPQVATKLGAPCVNIWGLGVESVFRGRGIASDLIGHVLARGYERGARHASVATQLWNHPAHATYVRAGFRPHTVLHGLDTQLPPT